MAVPGCTSPYLALPGCTWLNQAVLGCTMLYLALLGCAWLYQAVPGCTWLYLTVPGSTWLYLAVLGCTRLYLAVSGSAKVCHDLLYHILPLTGLSASVCTGLNAQNLSGMGWMGLDGLLYSVSTPSMSTALLCGANNFCTKVHKVWRSSFKRGNLARTVAASSAHPAANLLTWVGVFLQEPSYHF